MKKILSLVLAALLLCLALTACDPKGKAEESSQSKIPEITENTAPDAPFNGEDDIIE